MSWFGRTTSKYLHDGDETSFWSSVWALHGSVTMRLLPRLLVFGIGSLISMELHQLWPELALQVGPVEIAGSALGLMLVLRTNAGYDRWWEGRKAWGSIVNECRNMVLTALAYGPTDKAWQREFSHWCIAFAYVTRDSLRKQRQVYATLSTLVGPHAAEAIVQADHMPSFVVQHLALMLRQATSDGQLTGFALLTIEASRLRLLDCVGICERIASTPLPRVYVLKIRRFIAIYLLLLPLALVDKVAWWTPVLTMLVAYPVLGMDQIAHELQNPFLLQHLSHLPLDTLCAMIERNLKNMQYEFLQHQTNSQTDLV